MYPAPFLAFLGPFSFWANSSDMVGGEGAA